MTPSLPAIDHAIHRTNIYIQMKEKIDESTELLDPSLVDDIDKVDAEFVSNLLVKEMSQLSLIEQYNIDRDVKGMNMLAAAEPFELSSMGLEALNKHLKVKVSDYPHLRSKVLKNYDFRLKFARAEHFDPVKGVDRLEKYLALVKKYFGEENLKRPIMLSDLNKVERDLLRSGAIQTLPFRDSSGRKIMAYVGNLGTSHHTIENKIRVLVYFVQVMSEDEDTQKQGCVFLYLPLDFNSTISRELNHVLQVAPVRFSSFHFLLDDTPKFRKLAAWQLLMMPPESRARTRLHFGSIDKCQEAIKAYGIPSNFLPITHTGNVKILNHRQWLAFRRAKETAIDKGIEFDGIDCPSVRDVLTGKGPYVSRNPANIAYRKIMEERFLEHRYALSSERKTKISREVVDQIVQYGGRILVRQKSWWTEIDREGAREKVSVAFRDMRKTFSPLEKKRKHAFNEADSTIDEKKRKKTTDTHH